MVSELVAFLAARLDEDEAAAKLAAREGGTWKQDDPVRYPGSISSLGGQVVYDEGSPDEYQAAHIARYDPARALREVEAGRAIIAAYQPNGQGVAYTLEAGLEFALRQFAAVYRDHPACDPTWAPE
jgi:hypothetical protein